MAKKINIDWEAVISCASEELPINSERIIRLEMLTYGSNLHGRLEESVVVRYIPLRIGCFDLTPFPSQTNKTFVTYKIIDADTFVEEYIMDTSAYNFFEVTKLDIVNNRMEGLFGLSFVKREGSGGFAVFQDSVRFFNGCFSTEYDEI